MPASPTNIRRPLWSGFLLLALACGNLAVAQQSDSADAFDLERATRAPPADVAVLEQRAFAALSGLIGRMNPSSALPELREAADRGSAAAMQQLGSMYDLGIGVPQNSATADRYMRAAAERGNYKAQLYVGGLYLYGVRVEADQAQARVWFEAAANQQDPYTLYLLADMYSNGIGVEIDAALGFELLTRAAVLGYPDAVRRLGIELLQDEDRRDPARALAILDLAADGDPETALLLGYQYLIGSLIAKDVALGTRWVTAAAEKGNVQAQLLLADLAESGGGVEGNSQPAQQSREQIIAAASPDDRNGFAWRYSVSPDDALRNGPLAVQIMEELLAEADAVNAARLDTLAAAYAEAGRFEDAIATQQASIERLLGERGPQAPPVEAVQAMLPQLRDRLEAYRAGRPHRAPF